MGTIKLKSWSDIGISVNRTSGKLKVICPECRQRRSNKRDKSLSINIDKGVAHCHYCDSSFCLVNENNYMRELKINKEYVRPIWKNETNLSEKVVRYFESRGIPQSIIRQMKITEGREFMPQDGQEMNTIQFNYFLGDELVNIKYRTGNKHFKMVSGAELIPYNLNSIKGEKECIITEGEFDCLAFMASGFFNTISVPAGASTNTEYLDNYWDDYFEDKETIYIAVDTDEKGIILRNELVRRFGSDYCKIITYGDDCKDANELLIKRNSYALKECVNNAQEIKVDGVFTVTDFEDELDFLYENGLKRGFTIGLENFDKYCSFETKRICLLTGIPGHGKSEFLDEIVERLNILYGWRTAFFSPENFPLKYHASKLVSKLTGKKFESKSLPLNEYRQVKEYMDNNFYFIFPKDGFSVDTILDKAQYLIRRKGIKSLIIDPWNRLEHQMPSGMSETNYISQTLDRFSNFAQKNEVIIFLVAHPRKMNKNTVGQFEIPTLYDINGSANFYNKVDYGITVYRDKQNETTCIYVQKVKFRHLGETGKATFKYNLNNGRYVPCEEGQNPDWDNSNHIVTRLKKQIQESENIMLFDPIVPNEDFFSTYEGDMPF